VESDNRIKQILSYVFLILTEGQDKTCSYCWCSWPFSAATQTRWVLASSGWDSFCGWRFGLFTELSCRFRVIPSSV